MAAVTQRLMKEKLKQPKLQIFFYPWMQMANLDLPSCRLYSAIGYGKCIIYYLGIDVERGKITDKLCLPIEKNLQLTLLDEKEDVKNKLLEYLDVSKIPEEFISENERSTYNKYIEQQSSMFLKAKKGNKHQLDGKNAETLLKVFSSEVSPGLADDELIKDLPNAFFAITEKDSLKDEAILYALRLKQNGNDVQIKYYKDAYHGEIYNLLPVKNNAAYQIYQDVVKFIQEQIWIIRTERKF